jgi:glutathione S-transferase
MSSPSLTLLIGNKNYSSWSLRPWILLHEKKIPFKERVFTFGHGTTGVDDNFKKQVKPLSNSGKVPCLIDNNTTSVWDSLAIIEYLHEKFPQAGIYPQNMNDRALCRSVICEMHSGFLGMRNSLIMNITAQLPDAGAKVLKENQGAKADVERVLDIWTHLLAKYGGPFLFGKTFTAADAFYAPVATRFVTYRVPLSKQTQAYVDKIISLPSMKEWTRGALEEMKNGEKVPYLEPYRTTNNNKL